MKIVIPLILVLPFLTITLTNAFNNTITIYYNGTVKSELSNVSQFFLIGSDITDLRVVGSNYNISDGVMYLTNSKNVTYIFYNAKFPQGVIQVNEKYNFTIIVLLPTNVSISYMYPQPSNIQVVGGFYNITFKHVNGITILYSFYPKLQLTHSSDNDELYFILGLVISNAVLLSVIFLLHRGKIRIRNEKGRDDEIIEVVNDALDERDTIVLEAIKMGASTLADIVRQTGLPKSTAYRRIKKLVKLGYIEEMREGGKIKYVVKKKEN
jgi:uncharacterized membrane protein